MTPPKKACFADGGAVSKADQMIAEMNAKYGVSGNTPAPQPTPTPPPPPVQPPKEAPGSMLQRAAGLLGGRAKQIDKAAGYANGGKISGPGTPTSDSISAKVAETGEDILVSNQERIISAKQEALLERIAQMLGFDSVDAMLEAGTGKPVGPTIKSGKAAAEDGYTPWSVLDKEPEPPVDRKWQDTMTAATAPVAPGAAIMNAAAASPLPPMFNDAEKIGPSTTPSIAGKMLAPVTNLFADSATAARTGQDYSTVKAGREATSAPSPVSAASTPPVTAGKVEQYPMSRPGDRVPPSAPTKVTDKTVTAESAAAAYGPDSGRTYLGTMDLAAQNERMAKALGYAGVDDFNKQRRLKNDPAEQQAEVAANHNAVNMHQLEEAKQTSLLRGKLLDPNATPAEKAEAAAAIRAISGKTDVNKFGGHVVKGQIGEPDTFVTWDERTGQPVFAGTGADVTKAVQPRKVKPLPPGYTPEKILTEAKASGKDPAAVAARLAEYGIQYP